MMKEIYLKLYSLGPSQFIEAYAFEERKDTYIHLCLAFAHAWLGNTEKAMDILSPMPVEQFSPEEQSLFLEVKFMVAYQKKNIADAEALAVEALSFSNEALFSHELLARSALYKKKIGVAEKHYSEILELYPKHNNTIANLAVTFSRQKKYKKAFSLIYNIATLRLRILYKVLLWMLMPSGRFLAMICLLAIFLGFHNNMHLYIYSGVMASLTILFFSELIPKNNLTQIGLITIGVFVTIVWILSLVLRSGFTF